MRDTKLVPIKKMKVGDTFDHLVKPGCTTMASFEILELNGIYCKLKVYNREETYSTEGLFAEIPLTDAEFHAKYEDAAAALIEQLKTEITDMSNIGYHEMWNAWIDVDIYDFAATCHKEKIEVLGWFALGENSRMLMTDVELDIGIVARQNEDVFWCHARKQWIDDMIEEWEDTH